MSEATSATLPRAALVPTRAPSRPKAAAPSPVDSTRQLTMRYARFSLEPTASLFSYRANGTPVPRTLWVAPYAGRLLLWTHRRDQLLERLAAYPAASLAPCDARGRLLADPVPAHARIMHPEEFPTVEVAMNAKYGIRYRGARWAAWLGRILLLRPGGTVGVELTLLPGAVSTT